MIGANILIKLSTWANDSIYKIFVSNYSFKFLIVSLAYLLSINVTSIQKIYRI